MVTMAELQKQGLLGIHRLLFRIRPDHDEVAALFGRHVVETERVDALEAEIFQMPPEAPSPPTYGGRC